MTGDEFGRTIRSERSLVGMRKTIAKRLGESYRNAVHVTVSRTVDAEGLMAAVEDARAELDASISPEDVLLRALSATLEDHPAFNATFEDDTHRTFEDQNVGVAVDLEDGLVTPVIEGVEDRSLAAIHERRQDLVTRVKAGEYTMSDFQGGTFTVTNLGPLGVDGFSPVINPPEVAILGLGAIQERARPDSDGGVTFRRGLPLDLTFDHRVVDGADAARFLETLAGHLDEAMTFVEA